MITTKRETIIPVLFECKYEIHPLKKFQDEGHFVPAIRERDANGNETRQPRKWKGSQVHALTLFDSEGAQVLRALSDSREDAGRILGDQIRMNFWGLIRALKIAGLNTDQARKVKDERDRLTAWMLQHAPPAEFAKVLGIAEAAVAEYQAQEKSPELRGKIDSMLNGGIL